jgi:NarL family two-component system response regulator LiaR
MDQYDMKKIKILIVDDHAIVRMGLASTLETHPDLTIVGEADDGNAALKKVAELLPDLVLMDLMMPGIDGAKATAEIHRNFPCVKILILTTYGTANGIAHALEAGASGAVMKNIECSELAEVIRSVVAGETVIAPEIHKNLKAAPPIKDLTERQRQILTDMVEGRTDAEIAKSLKLSSNSVRDHITAIFNKLGADNRADAVSIALRKHLLKI